MQNFAVWERIVVGFAILSQAILLRRLWREGLAGSYRFLSIYLAAAIIQAAAVAPLKQNSNAYAIFYFVSSPIFWLLSYLVVLELYRLILEDFPGISSAGRHGLSWCMAIALTIAALAAWRGAQGTTGRFPFLRIFYSVERSAIFGLLIFLVLIQIFLFRYRLRLSPNRIIYSVGYAAYFGIGIAGDTVAAQVLGARFAIPVTLGFAAVASLLLLIGAFLLSHAGEQRPLLEPDDHTEDRRKLQQQLLEMNQVLTRVARGGR